MKTVVAIVVLDRQVALEMTVDPVQECMEGEEVELGITLSNRGSLATDATLAVYASGRTLSETKIPIEENSSKKWKIKFKASIANSALTILTRYRDHKNASQDIQRNVELAMKEAERVKIDTSALDVFDNL